MSMLQLLAANFAVTTGGNQIIVENAPINIGDSFGGGYYAGTYSLTGDNNPTHLLIVADKSYELSGTAAWSTINQAILTNDYDGLYNTNQLNDSNHPLCQQVRSLNIGGYTDWYIPSKYEMWMLKEVFAPFAGGTSTSDGANPYKFLKSTTNWPNSSLPGGSWDARWRSDGSQVFTSDYYWTSTEASSSQVYAMSIISGIPTSDSKTAGSNKYRPIRRVPYSNFITTIGNAKGPFRYWRWRINALSSGTFLYVDEFTFQYNGLDVNLVGATVSALNGYNNNSSLVPRNIINQSIDYEYIDFNFGTNGYTDFRFDLGYPFSFTGYRWRTAASAGGDPKSWTIQASTDNTNWVVIDTVTNYVATTARNTYQPAVSFNPIPPAEIGDSFGGGYYAGLLSTSADGVPTHILVVAPKATGEATLQYNPDLTADTGATSTIDGPTNTNNLNDAQHPAAQFCKNLSIGGYTDWYMPALDELDIIYRNLKPTEVYQQNNVYGINNYSVIKSANNYTNARPGRVNNPIFRAGGSEALPVNYILSSTQNTSSTVRSIDFDNGLRFNQYKDEPTPVRAIRRVPCTIAGSGNVIGPYRYWRWYVSDVADAGAEDGMQAAEFRFQFHGVNISLVGAAVSAPGVGTGGGTAENVERLINGNLDEKFYNSLSTGVTDVRIDLVNARSFTGYQWATANDMPSRDPKSWTVQASNDGTNWTVIHTVSNYTATSNRNTWQTAWNF